MTHEDIKLIVDNSVGVAILFAFVLGFWIYAHYSTKENK